MKTDASIQTEAAAWLVRQDDSAGFDRAAFESWLAADSRHRQAYRAQERIWTTAERLKTFRPSDGSVDARVLKNSGRATRPRRLSWAMAAAASLLALGIITWQLRRSPQETYSTQTGGFQRTLLADSSVVLINTDSTLRVDFSPQLRRVTLVRGEAHFEVARDPRRPFEVRAGDSTVRAVGTAFTVRMRDTSEIDVLVTEGRVVIRRAGDSMLKTPEQTDMPPGRSPTAEHPEVSGSTVAVMAGELADLSSARVQSHALSESEVLRREAWTRGELVFRGTLLPEAITEFNRYNRRKLVLEDASLTTVALGGTFRATDVDGFVRGLKSSFGIHAREVDGVIRISRTLP